MLCLGRYLYVNPDGPIESYRQDLRMTTLRDGATGRAAAAAAQSRQIRNVRPSGPTTSLPTNLFVALLVVLFLWDSMVEPSFMFFWIVLVKSPLLAAILFTSFVATVFVAITFKVATLATASGSISNNYGRKPLLSVGLLLMVRACTI